MDENEKMDELRSQIKDLKTDVEILHSEAQRQRELLSECYEIIYHKGAWLSLSDENIKGLRQYIEERKAKGLSQPNILQLWGV